MKTFDLKDILRELDGWSDREICFLCKGNGPFHRHHKTFRSHGGSDSASNLVLLCEVCHAAAHGIHAFKDGFDCSQCPVLKIRGCYFGEAVLGREIVTPMPWEKEF